MSVASSALVSGATTATITNLKSACIPYSRLKASCQPEAPAGGIGVTVHVGGNSHALSVAEGGTTSDVTELAGSGNVWGSNSDLYAEITSLTGSFAGTVLVMVANGN